MVTIYIQCFKNGCANFNNHFALVKSNFKSFSLKFVNIVNIPNSNISSLKLRYLKLRLVLRKICTTRSETHYTKEKKKITIIVHTKKNREINLLYDDA